MSGGKKQITGILFDLDGTLMDSETGSYNQMVDTVKLMNEHAAPEVGAAGAPLEYSLPIHRGLIGTGPTVWPRLIFDALGIWYSGAPPASTSSAEEKMSEEEKAVRVAEKLAIKEKSTKWVWKTAPPIKPEHVAPGDELPVAGEVVTPEHYVAVVHAVGLAKGFHIPLMPGVAEFFKKLQAHPELSKIPLSIATSSRRKYACLKLDSHPTTFTPGLIKTLTCGSDEEVAHCKPAPDIFLVSQDKVRAWREEENMPVVAKEDELWVVYEDSPSGVKSGKAAGCFTIAVADPKFNDGTHEWMQLADSVLTCEEGPILQSIKVLETLVGYEA